jgi:hypothetical protein
MAVSTFLIVNPAGEELPGVTEQVAFQSYVLVDVYRPVGGEMVLIYHDESHNLITNVGLHVITRNLRVQTSTWQWTTVAPPGGLGGNGKYYRGGEPKYIALSSDGTAAAYEHSSWQAFDDSYLPAGTDIEITAGGLARMSGTVAVVSYTPGSGPTKGSLTYSISYTFLATSSFTGVNSVKKAGLFVGAYSSTNDGSTNLVPISPLVAENIFTDPVSLNPQDQIAITWSITLG